MSEATKAVFVSYAREDTPAAQRIAEALRSHGVEVWFDQNELRGGDAWDQKIRQQIGDCTLFLPVISAHTQERNKGYFRLEWKLAIEQTHLMLEGVPYLAPVVIDDTAESGAAVPAEFMRVQWTRLPGALPTPQFVEQIKRLLDAPASAMGAGRPRPAQRDEGVASPTKPRSSGIPLWLAGVVGVALLGAIAYLALRPAATEPPAAETKTASVPPSSNLPPAASPVPTAPASVDDKSIAVLAFADLSEARNSEYFSDGISENLLDALAKVPGLRVAARTSAFYFKGKNVPIPEIAAKLNVAYVVEGSVQRAGDNVRITAQLIKAADGYHVWSEHFDRELKNVFAVQDEIAGLIATQLSLKLGARPAAATAAVNPAAFELYLQARQAWNLRNAAGFDRAEELLNRVLALEPNFARAYAALADVWLVRDQSGDQPQKKIGTYGQLNSPEFARIRAQIDRALALDPNLAEAHATLGNLLSFHAQQEEAARELRRAIALNPNYASAHQWLGRALMTDGRFEEGCNELARAAELDPFSSRILDNYSIAMDIQGKYAEGIALLDRALVLQPDSLQAAAFKAVFLAEAGRHEEAVSLIRSLPYQGTGYVDEAAEVFARTGHTPEAERLLADATDVRIRTSILASLGRPEEALLLMEPADIGVQFFSDVLIDPDFDPVRHHPRYLKLIETLGLTEVNARAQAWRAAHPLPKNK